MKNLIRTITVFALSLLCFTLNAQTKAEKYGWKLAIQSYSFHKFTLMEALDKTQQLGIHYIEVYPGHKLGGSFGDKVFDYNLDYKSIQKVKEIAASKGIKIIASGVFVSQKPAEWAKEFRFAKMMDLDFITCEPDLKDWDLVEKYAREYKVKVAVHNHPKPSTYWKPEYLINAIQGRCHLLGSCADVGHWRRNDLDQLQCLKDLKGRIISLHFKDIAQEKNAKGEQEDVIWGKGCLNVKQMLLELKAQKFKGYFSIEYENNWENSVPDIKQCIDYFNETTEAIL